MAYERKKNFPRLLIRGEARRAPIGKRRRESGVVGGHASNLSVKPR